MKRNIIFIVYFFLLIELPIVGVFASNFDSLYSSANSAFLLRNWCLASELFEKIINLFPNHKKSSEIALKLTYCRYKLLPEKVYQYKIQEIKKINEDLKKIENLKDSNLEKLKKEVMLYNKFLYTPTNFYKSAELSIDLMDTVISDNELTKILLKNNPVMFYDFIEKWIGKQKDYIPLKLYAKLKYLQANALFLIMLSPLLVQNYENIVKSWKINDLTQRCYDLLITAFECSDLTLKRDVAVFGANFELLCEDICSLGKVAKITSNYDLKTDMKRYKRMEKDFFRKYLGEKIKSITPSYWLVLW